MFPYNPSRGVHMEPTLLNLPWSLQVALAGGYAAYFTATTGNRAHHRPIDIAFSTLVFSLFAGMIYGLIIRNQNQYLAGSQYFAGAIAFVGSVLVGGIWRKWGAPGYRWLLRTFRVTLSDDTPAALVSLMNDTKHDLTQIAVKLDDGTQLRCEDTSQFAHLPFGPCQLGPSGDIALYLTHADEPDGTEKVQEHVHDPDYGSRLVYIPAARVKEVAVRYKRRRSRLRPLRWRG
jgi:hypothetical protein